MHIQYDVIVMVFAIRPTFRIFNLTPRENTFFNNIKIVYLCHMDDSLLIKISNEQEGGVLVV